MSTVEHVNMREKHWSDNIAEDKAIKQSVANLKEIYFPRIKFVLEDTSYIFSEEMLEVAKLAISIFDGTIDSLDLTRVTSFQKSLVDTFPPKFKESLQKKTIEPVSIVISSDDDDSGKGESPAHAISPLIDLSTKDVDERKCNAANFAPSRAVQQYVSSPLTNFSFPSGVHAGETHQFHTSAAPNVRANQRSASNLEVLDNPRGVSSTNSCSNGQTMKNSGQSTHKASGNFVDRSTHRDEYSQNQANDQRQTSANSTKSHPCNYFANKNDRTSDSNHIIQQMHVASNTKAAPKVSSSTPSTGPSTQNFRPTMAESAYGCKNGRSINNNPGHAQQQRQTSVNSTNSHHLNSFANEKNRTSDSNQINQHIDVASSTKAAPKASSSAPSIGLIVPKLIKGFIAIQIPVPAAATMISENDILEALSPNDITETMKEPTPASKTPPTPPVSENNKQPPPRRKSICLPKGKIGKTQESLSNFSLKNILPINPSKHAKPSSNTPRNVISLNEKSQIVPIQPKMMTAEEKERKIEKIKESLAKKQNLISKPKTTSISGPSSTLPVAMSEESSSKRRDSSPSSSTSSSSETDDKPAPHSIPSKSKKSHLRTTDRTKPSTSKAVEMSEDESSAATRSSSKRKTRLSSKFKDPLKSSTSSSSETEEESTSSTKKKYHLRNGKPSTSKAVKMSEDESSAAPPVTRSSSKRKTRSSSQFKDQLTSSASSSAETEEESTLKTSFGKSNPNNNKTKSRQPISKRRGRPKGSVNKQKKKLKTDTTVIERIPEVHVNIEIENLQHSPIGTTEPDENIMSNIEQEMDKIFNGATSTDKSDNPEKAAEDDEEGEGSLLVEIKSKGRPKKVPRMRTPSPGIPDNNFPTVKEENLEEEDDENYDIM